MRDHLRSRIEACGDDVVVVAHSLGGVAAVDLLATTDLPTVTGLVTVGSQAPLLYELDILPGLRFGTPLPPTFPRWLNVFDARDLLGYTSGGLFPGRVTDHEVDNRWGFPLAPHHLLRQQAPIQRARRLHPVTDPLRTRGSSSASSGTGWGWVRDGTSTARPSTRAGSWSGWRTTAGLAGNISAHVTALPHNQPEVDQIGRRGWRSRPPMTT